MLIKEGRPCGEGLSKTLQINLLRENCMHKLLQAYNLLAVVTCTAQNLKEFENCSNVLFFKPNTILLLVVSDNFQWRQPHESKDCLPQKLLHWAELHTVYIVNLLLKIPKASCCTWPSIQPRFTEALLSNINTCACTVN